MESRKKINSTTKSRAQDRGDARNDPRLQAAINLDTSLASQMSALSAISFSPERAPRDDANFLGMINRDSMNIQEYNQKQPQA